MEYRTSTDEPVTWVRIAPDAALPGHLILPVKPDGLVMILQAASDFPDTAGRRSMARLFQTAGFATLSLDLFSAGDAQASEDKPSQYLRLAFLAERLSGAIDWVKSDELTTPFPVGLLGLGDAGPAALVAAAQKPAVRSIVCYSDHPDLAGPALCRVQVPTLLVAHSVEPEHVRRNELALDQLASTEKVLERLPTASAGPSELESVARRAVEWFARNLGNESEPF